MKPIFRYYFGIILIVSYSKLCAIPFSSISNDTIAWNTTLNEFLETLDKDEQKEQLRDWVVLSCINKLSSSKDDVFKSLYDFPPVRYDFRKGFDNYSYGEFRYVRYQGAIVVFLPHDSDKKQEYIAQSVDDYRMIYSVKPSQVVVFNYHIDDHPPYLTTYSYDTTYSTAIVFSSEFGYIEKTVSSSTSLRDFINSIDNVVYAEIKGGDNAVTFGGRRLLNHRTRNIGFDDIVTLYKADKKLKDYHIAKLKREGLKEEYKSIFMKM